MSREPRLRRMVVREIVPGRLWLFVALVVALVIVAGVSGWFAGRHFLLAGLVGDQVPAGGAELLERLASENRTMRDELAISRNGDELSRAVEERVRSENRELQDRIAELEQAVASYRRVAVPDAGGKGLRIERVELQSAGTPSGWLLSAVLLRTGGTDSTLGGYLEGTLLADGPAGRVALPLAQLLPATQRAFQVRYVTEMKVELQLPPALVPVRLDLVAVLTEPRPERIEKSWQRQSVRAKGGVGNAGQE